MNASDNGHDAAAQAEAVYAAHAYRLMRNLIERILDEARTRGGPDAAAAANRGCAAAIIRMAQHVELPVPDAAPAASPEIQ